MKTSLATPLAPSISLRVSQRRRRWPLWLAGALLLVGAAAVAVDPIVEWQVRRSFAFLQPAYRVSFRDASLRPSRGSVVIRDLEVVKPSAGGHEQPWISIERLEVSLATQEWMKLRPAAEIGVQGLTVNLIGDRDPRRRQLEPDVPDFMERLERTLPFPADRVMLKGAEVRFADHEKPSLPPITITGLDATIESLAPESAKARGAPTTIAATGALMKTAEVSLFFTADPLDKGRFFAGRVVIERFDLSTLERALASETGLAVKRGWLDAVAELECRDGLLRGGVRPTFRDTKVVAGKPGLDNEINALVVDGALRSLSEGGPRGGTLRTVVPIRGDLDRPEFQAWQLLSNVVRNALTAGINEGLKLQLNPDAKR
jgi:hypothetical protein